MGMRQVDRIAKIEKFLEGRYQVSEYPTLENQFQEWSKSLPLKGLRVVDVTPLFKNTLLKYRSLLAAGAELVVGKCSFISADKEVLEFCQNELKLEVIDGAVEGADIVLDCAASYVSSVTKLGYVELTKSGIEKYSQSGRLCYAADSSKIKRLETELGTGESFFRAMLQLGYEYSSWEGKQLVVFGSGKVGRGLVRYAKEYKADVVVVSDPQMPIEGVEIINFKNQEAVEEAINSAYCVVMATGVERAFEKTVRIEKVIESQSLWANMGAEDEFGYSVPNSRVLREKKTINFILGEPTHLKFIDATMALHNYGAEWIVENHSTHLDGGIILPDSELEQKFLDITSQMGDINVNI